MASSARMPTYMVPSRMLTRYRLESIGVGSVPTFLLMASMISLLSASFEQYTHVLSFHTQSAGGHPSVPAS